MKKVTIQLNCGESTCASVPGVFCAFMGATKFGTVPVCLLFPGPSQAHTVLYENDAGWVARCQRCMEVAE